MSKYTLQFIYFPDKFAMTSATFIDSFIASAKVFIDTIYQHNTVINQSASNYKIDVSL